MRTNKLERLSAKRQKNGSFFTVYAHWILLFPFLLLFVTLIILPILCAIGLSFTDFNGMETPGFTLLDNYIRVFSKDAVFMQKILPRIQGSSGAIKMVLSDLFKKCAGDYAGFNGSAAYEQMEAYLDSRDCKYPNSAKKIAFMMRRYEEDGFTSYWL